MPDMLVKLYEEHDCSALVNLLKEKKIYIKRAMAPDLYKILEFVRTQFNDGWAGETAKAILNTPSSCYIAVKDKEIVGFACYDATARGFFGPTGVSEQMRGAGVGKALYLSCLCAMKEQGYGYAIVGSAGPTEFYAKTSGAVEIPDCWPGVYRDLCWVEE